MPGVTVDGGDPVAVHETVGAAVARARAGDGPTLVESQRLPAVSAHGNIIAPPGVPLHFPEHEAIEEFGAREEYEAALRGDPVPRFRGALVSDGTLTAAEADEIAERRARRDAGGGRVRRSRARSPSSSPRSTTSTPEDAERPMAHELPYIAAIDEAIQLEMERDPNVLYFGQNMATTENEPFVDAFGHDRVRVTPISETAEIGIAIGAAMAGYRPVVELYMAEFMLVAMDQVVNEAPRFRYMSGGQVKVPLVLKAGYGFTAGWAGQHTGTLTRAVHGRAGPEGRGAVDRRRRQGPDGDGHPRRQPGRLPAPLPAHARARRGARRRAPRAVRRGGGPPRGRRRHDRRAPAGWSARRSPRPSTLAGEGIEAEVIDPRTLAPLDLAHDPRVGREDRPARARRPGAAPRVGRGA